MPDQMDIESVLAEISQLTGPLGPFVSIEGRLIAQEDWLAQLKVDAVAPLTTLLLRPDAAWEQDDLDVEEAMLLAGDALARLGALDPQAVEAAFRTLLAVPHCQLIALYGIGEWGDQRMLPDLAALCTATSDPELAVELACTLGMLGGAGTAGLLGQLARKFPDNQSLQNEVATALESLQG
jgi:hypothetical protein